MTTNNKQKKGFAPIIIILAIVVALGLGGYYFLKQNQNKPSSSPATAPAKTFNPTAKMKTYTNSEYGFSVQYPARFSPFPVIQRDRGGDEYYKTVESLVSSNNKESNISISVITNVDIYENVDVVKVATREVTDAGYKYTVSPTTINSYSAAITSMAEAVTVDNVSYKTTTITIKHPKLNIYVVLIVPSDVSKVEFEEILSSFKFIENSDPILVNNLVNNFYTAIESQNGKMLFSYFTPPSTPKENKDFTWLTGADLAGDSVYRAFFRQKITNSKINEIIRVNDTTFAIKVSDQLTGIPSAGSEKTVYTPKTRSVVLTIIKSGDKWLVDKFTDPSNTSNSGNAGSPKYNGFGQ